VKGIKSKARATRALRSLCKDLTRETKKRKGCNRLGHIEDMCWKLHPELRPK
jgi:hypothetical protein